MFLPSVYDALVVTRPSTHFRDGIVVTNRMLEFSEYFVELPFNESYLLGIIHLISVNYFIGYKDISKQNNYIYQRNVIGGFTAVFIFIKSYASCLVAELSQLCYRGILRAIALASTDGLCTFSCSFMISLQPVIVPVGRISLGRIINVVGSSIDSYVDMALSSQYQCSASYNTILCVSSCADTSYPLSYPKHTIEIGSINIYPSLDYY